MAITPNSMIYFCNVPWGDDYTHLCDSSTLNATLTSTALITTATNYTYIRKDSTINVSINIDTLIGANYVMYKNVNHENKWFYAFIESMEYKSDMATAVKIKTDVYQTWRSNFTIPACFVEREHVNDDTIGTHTVDENLETGEYLKVSITRWTELNDLAIIVGATQTAVTPKTRIAGRIYNGVYSGFGYYAFFKSSVFDDHITPLRDFINQYDLEGIENSLITIFTFPKALLPSGTVSGELIEGNNLISPVASKSISITKSTINGYTPRNKKLFTHPYNFLHVTNLQGQSFDLHLEKFKSGYPTTINFKAQGCMIPGAKVGCYTTDYKITDTVNNTNEEELLTISNYPLCNWTSDAWNNWIAQNALGIGASAATSALSMVTGALTGQPMAIAGGAIGVFSQLSQIYAKYIEPAHVKGNANNSTLNVAMSNQLFEFSQTQIRAEYAKIIDEYFDLYGYKVARVKAPNLKGRTNWNYIKTIDCIIKGGIPEQDKKQLRDIFNKGTTIWHTWTNIGDYSKANTIVTP